MLFRNLSAALAGLSMLVLVPSALAQTTTASMDNFTTACLSAGPSLLGETPPEVDVPSIMTPLCGCLVSEFSAYPQADVDELAADLSGTSTDASHTAHGGYQALQERAAAGLAKCFANPEVTAAMAAAEAAATPAPAETTPAPAAPATP